MAEESSEHFKREMIGISRIGESTNQGQTHLGELWRDAVSWCINVKLRIFTYTIEVILKNKLNI